MFNQLKELYSLLTAEQRRKLKRLQVLVVLMAFAEIAGVASIGPFMALVGDISQLQGDGIVADTYRASGIEDPHEFIFWVGVSVLVVLFCSACISMFTVWRLAIYGNQIGAEISSRLFRHYIYQPWLFHASGNSSQLINKVSQECQRVTNNIINPLMQMNAKSVLAMFIIVGIFAYNPIMAIFGVVVFISTYMLLFKTVRKKLDQNGADISETQKVRFKLLGEALGGIKDVLLLGRQAIFIERFDKASTQFAKGQGTTQALSLVPRYAMELIAFGSVIFLILYLLSKHESNLGSILPILSVYALAGFKLLPAFQQIYTSLSNIRGNLAAFDNLRHDLTESVDLKYQGEEKNKVFQRTSHPMKVNTHIELKNVIFTYPDKKIPALNNISLSIPVNTMVGLVGFSGSGKSTVIDIMLGLINPSHGELQIDGKAINDTNRRNWQNSIGLVSQSIFLADSSIRENIAFGLPLDVIDDEKIERSIQMANLDEMIEKLPEGLMTQVGERGVQLSGGQRQRIGIARALYNDADVLVLDEATSALDGITEKLIMDAIHNFSGNKTIVMIAHRLATVKACDNIYVMSEGKVIDSGSYDHLMHASELFKKMSLHA